MNAHIELWKNGAVDVLRLFFESSCPMPEMLAVLAVGFLACVTVVSLAGKALGMPNMSWGQGLVVCVVGLVVIAAGVIALYVYVMPRAHIPLEPRDTLLIAVGVLTILIVIPIQRRLERANYLESLISLLFGIAAAGMLMILVCTILGSVREQKVEFRKIRNEVQEHNRIVESAQDLR